jgi:hypothetical protein
MCNGLAMNSKSILSALAASFLVVACGGGDRQPSDGELEAFVNSLEADERDRNAAEISAARVAEDRRELKAEKRLERSEAKRRQ